MLLAQFSIYVIEGTVLALCGALFLFAVFRNQKLRRRYDILIAQFFTNVICGLATLTAGVGRLTVLFSEIKTLRSRQQCMLMPWNILFLWADPMSAIVVLITSIDRLCALMLPIFYYKNPRRFALSLIGFSHGFMILCMIFDWSTTVGDTEELYSPLCWYIPNTLNLRQCYSKQITFHYIS
ncbi:unnamed protein product [Anisakis simplex]|uniref:G_PROTEIN_RECEP_F1_2 domain-containing protein n=1 Tax=Anisakis simplex TaxID=6269 RepID=A0A0M3JWT2_ANISI|nr:unnamed protein product [Anisakis simplex]